MSEPPSTAMCCLARVPAGQHRLARASTGTLLLFALVAACAAGQATATAAAATSYVVCVVPNAPFVMVDNTSATGYSGYEWDMFTLVATGLGITFTTLQMSTFSDLLAALALPQADPNHCDIGPSAIPLTFPVGTSNTSLKFSNPTFRSGYAIVTSVQWNPFDMWSFGRVFTNELWGYLIGTALFLSVLAYIVERDFTARGNGKTKYPVPLRPGMYEAVYNCVGKLFNIVQDLRVTSLPGKLLSLAWGFLVLVVISMYTAVVASAMTAVTYRTTINGLTDIQNGKYVVVSDQQLVTNFTNYGFTPVGMPFNSDVEGIAMLDRVASGAAAAVVLPLPWLKYQISQRCDVMMVDSMFKYVSNVVGFSPYMTDLFIYQWNSQLNLQMQQGMYEILQTAYVKSQNCGQSSSTVITLIQLEGLWYILIAFIGLAMILLILPKISRRFETDIARGESGSQFSFSMKSMGSVIAKSGRSFAERVTGSGRHGGGGEGSSRRSGGGDGAGGSARGSASMDNNHGHTSMDFRGSNGASVVPTASSKGRPDAEVATPTAAGQNRDGASPFETWNGGGQSFGSVSAGRGAGGSGIGGTGMAHEASATRKKAVTLVAPVAAM